MSVGAERAVLAAVQSVLKQDAAIRDLFGDPVRVDNLRPVDPVFPFLTWGEVTTRVREGGQNPGLEIALSLHAWSRSGGRGEALDCVAALRSALHDVALNAADLAITLCLVTFSDVFRASDPETLHAIVRLRILCEPI